jgi:TonB-linked SusC/RagA family outer membrane protein
MKKINPQWLCRWKIICIFLMSYFFVIPAMSQITVNGKVTDKSGNGIASVTVTLRNTTLGTASDANGNYILTATLSPGNYTVRFTGVGLKTVDKGLAVGSAKTYTVDAQLADDALGLDEVIVTGTSLGTTRRSMGSYISTVNADDLTKGATSNVLQALQGKTAGAQITQNSGDPSGGISVRLRGISSINGSSEPLYIVDGIIVSNSTTRVTNTQSGYDGNLFVGNPGQNRLADINPDDIERIEVLNGAAAAAIYGSRANAGVVQIFTKRGKAGKPVVTFSTNFLVNQIRKKIGVNEAPVKFGGPTDGPGAFTQDIITAVGTPAELLTNTTPVTRYDYQDYIFQTALGTDNNVSVSGGTEKTKYYLSGAYYYNGGIIKNTDFQRYSFRSNVEQAITDKLTVSMGLNYINSFSDEKPDGNSFFSPINSINIIANYHDIQQRDALGNIQAVGERQRVNPVSIIEDFHQKEETNRVLADAKANWKLLKNLTFDYTLGIDNYSQHGETYLPPYAYAVNPGFWGGGIAIDPTQNGYASAATYNYFDITNVANLTYQANINKNLSSTTQMGGSLEYQRTSFILQQGRGLAPLIHTVVSAASTKLDGADSRSELSISGVYLQQNFKFKNQFYLTGAVRMDGSSVFGLNQRNQVYVKGSGSYVLSSADFWDNMGVSSWWNLFKLRMAYGQSGNLTGIGAYDRFNAYSSAGFLGRTSFFSSATLANAEMKPERQEETEIGTDLAFLDSRIGINFNYYFKHLSDLLLDRLIAPTTGFTSKLDNFGSLENKGFEIVLTVVPVQNKNVRWELTGIYNQNRNKAGNIGQTLTLLSTNAGAPIALIAGQPIGVFYGTFFATDNGQGLKNASGIPVQEAGVQNSPLSYTPQRDANGLPTGGVVRKIIGDPNPDYTASLVNEVSYKAFDLRVQLDAVQGVDVWDADWRTRQGVGSGLVSEQEDEGKIPRGYIAGVYNIEQWRVDDGSFVKLREISIGYNFGKIKNIFSNLTARFSGRNLISWDHYKGFDPEVNGPGQSTLLRGVDFGSVPIPATFSIGVTAKF